MVEEFVSFARIPQPVFDKYNICDLVGEVIFSRENNKLNISYKYDHPKEPVIITCDNNQIVRVMTNLLKNAEESIEEKIESNKSPINGSIYVHIGYKEDKCEIKIIDNGKGFSDNIISRLTEPYVTTKSKGTGLGLAIVKKIIEDHNGELIFSNIEGGACVCIVFPLER